MAKRLITTLIVDDEIDMRLLVRTVLHLAANGFEVVGEAGDGFEALEAYHGLDPPPIPDVVVLDNRLPKLSGLMTAEKMLKIRPDQIVILYSAYLDDDVRRAAAAIGIAECVSKNQLNELPGIIKRLVGGGAAQAANVAPDA